MQYREQNSHWVDAADSLRLLADIRNLLTHNRTSTHGYPVAITGRSLDELREIHRRLSEPEEVVARFRRPVDTVNPDDTLASVLVRAFEKGYSQFPVLNEGRFVGLITEHEISRWLGRSVPTTAVNVDLSAVTVEEVVREKDSFSENTPIFGFARLDAPVEQVMTRFLRHPMLEVILLTISGNGSSPIEGIVTQWDAARYPESPK